jgi:hypothetical protein
VEEELRKLRDAFIIHKKKSPPLIVRQKKKKQQGIYKIIKLNLWFFKGFSCPMTMLAHLTY